MHGEVWNKKQKQKQKLMTFACDVRTLLKIARTTTVSRLVKME
jgi:hypothetical protein